MGYSQQGFIQKLLLGLFITLPAIRLDEIGACNSRHFRLIKHSG
jgi:hypothetical protein